MISEAAYDVGDIIFSVFVYLILRIGVSLVTSIVTICVLCDKKIAPQAIGGASCFESVTVSVGVLQWLKWMHDAANKVQEIISENETRAVFFI